MLSANLTLERIGQAAPVPILWTRQNPDHKKGAAVNGPEDVYKAMKFLEAEDREMLYALHLDAKNQIIAMEIVTVGTLTNSLIHPREIFKGAILNNSARIILVHNHPSGDATPSEDDLTVTERCMNAGELLGIEVIDHVIIGAGDYRSIKTHYEAAAKKRERSIKRLKKRYSNAIETLVGVNETMKGRDNITGDNIKKFSRKLRKAIYNLFLSEGAEQKNLRERYRYYKTYLQVYRDHR